MTITEEISTMFDKPIFILCKPNQKAPIGDDWGDRGKTWAEIEESREHNPRLNVGILLGPKSGVIDIEFDSPVAAAKGREIFGDLLDKTPSWSSTRGTHHIFLYDPRLDALKGVAKLHGIECRLGNSAQVQSIVPPSTVDGVTRQWTTKGEVEQLPEAFLEALLATAKPKATDEAKPSAADGESRDRTLVRFERYFNKRTIPYEVETLPTGNYKVKIGFDLIRGRGHERGANVVFINMGGAYTYENLHTDCLDKTWADVEEIHGELIPTIKISDDLERNVDEAIRTLADADIYQRGVLVKVVHAPQPLPQMLVDNGGARLNQVEKPTLLETLSSCARFLRYDAEDDEWRAVSPPARIVSGVYARGEYPGVKQIHGVNLSPILRPDGTIVRTPGYDAQTGRYLDINGDYPRLMPVDQAVELLLDVVSDFPFVDDTHRSAWLASLITMVSRSAFGGPSPLFFFDANASRAGKGLLTDAISVILSGSPASRFSAPTTDEEWNKVIVSIALSGIPVAVIDNVKGKLGGPSLENALTASRYAGRILGVNKTVEIAVTWGWQATGNNCTLTTDMVGRTVPCRIETMLDDPGSREGFKYPDLIQHVTAHRRELAIAALSIPSHFIREGRPDQKLKTWGGFENWSSLVRQSIVWAGQPDCDNRWVLQKDADTERNLLALFIDGWPAGRACRVGEILAVADELPDDHSLKVAIADLCGRQPDAAKIGIYLRDHKRRVINGLYINHTEGTKPKWFVAKVAA